MPGLPVRRKAASHFTLCLTDSRANLSDDGLYILHFMEIKGI
jgi:hypothetical protein